MILCEGDCSLQALQPMAPDPARRFPGQAPHKLLQDYFCQHACLPLRCPGLQPPSDGPHECPVLPCHLTSPELSAVILWGEAQEIQHCMKDVVKTAMRSRWQAQSHRLSVPDSSGSNHSAYSVFRHHCSTTDPHSIR